MNIESLYSTLKKHGKGKHNRGKGKLVFDKEIFMRDINYVKESIIAYIFGLILIHMLDVYGEASIFTGFMFGVLTTLFLSSIIPIIYHAFIVEED